MLPKDWWDSFYLKMDKSCIGKPLTCSLSLTQLDKLMFIRFNLYLTMFEIYDLILCRICFTAVLKTTICDLEEDLSK